MLFLYLLFTFFYVDFVYSQENEFDMDVKKEVGTESYSDFSLINRVDIPNLDNVDFISVRLLNKFKLKNQKLHIGFLQEKDPYEIDITDLYKYYLAINLPNTAIYLGNYLCGYGQGLVFSAPKHTSRIYAPTDVHMHKTRGILPDIYSYYEDNPYLHGVASSIAIGNIVFDLFYSSHYIDASTNVDGSAKTIYFDGYHTGYKKKYKDTLKEILYGTHVGANATFGEFGLTYYRANYKPKLRPNTDNKLAGEVNELLGADIQFFLKNYVIFGEYAYSKNEVEDSAEILGITGKFGDFLDIGVSYRDYGNRFHNIHSFAFSLEPDSNPYNERGYYIGTQLYIKRKQQIFAYHEIIEKDVQSEGYIKESMVLEDAIGANLKSKKFKLRAFTKLNNRKTTIKLIEDNKMVPILLKRIISQLNIETHLKNVKIVGELKYLLQPIQKYSQKEYGSLISLRTKIPILKFLCLKGGISICKIKTSRFISTYPYRPQLWHFEDTVFGGHFYTYRSSGWRIWLVSDIRINRKNIAVKYTRALGRSGIEFQLSFLK